MQSSDPGLDTTVTHAPASSSGLLSDAEVEQLGALHTEYYFHTECGQRIEQAKEANDEHEVLALRTRVREQVEDRLKAEGHPWADVWARAVAHDHILHDAKYRVMLDWFNEWVARSTEARQFDRFTNAEPLGTGGFGTVFKAFDPTRDDWVAVKVPYVRRKAMPSDRNTDVSSVNHVLRFFAEARKHARITVQGSVPLLDNRIPVVIENDQVQIDRVLENLRHNPLWFSMPLRKCNLKAFLETNGGTLSEREAVRIMERVGEALRSLHSQRPEAIYHRDLKPANILLTHDNWPEITDYGLSVGGFDQPATGNAVSGTWEYMSPEHVRGLAATAESDIWSWGVILYELISGRLPFGGSDLTGRIENSIFASLDVAVPECPRWLAEIVDRCLRKKPEGKPEFNSFAEVLKALKSPIVAPDATQEIRDTESVRNAPFTRKKYNDFPLLPQCMDQTGVAQAVGVRYIECLEASCFNFVCQHRRLPATELIDRVAAIVKLHALFGGRLVIESMALLESPVLLTLFRTPEFRAYLQMNPEFISLASSASGEERTRATDRQGIALRGFDRATDSEWLSSTHPALEPIRRIARLLRSEHEIDPARIFGDMSPEGSGQLISSSPYLEGAVYGAAHFVNDTRTIVRPGRPATRVYQILVEACEGRHRRLAPEHEARIQQALEFLESNFDDPSATSHSEIIAAVNHRLGRHHPAAKPILQTASHAFNAAIVRSLDPDYGAYEFFELGAPIGLYLDSLRDVLVATNLKHRANSPLAALARRCVFPWALYDIGWLDVLHASQDPDCLASAHRFQMAMSRQGVAAEGELEDAVDRHVRNLSKVLTREQPRELRPWVWLIGGVGVVVGLPIKLLSKLASRPMVTAGAGQPKAETIVFGGRRYVVAETMRRAAEDFIPRPQPMDERQ